MPLTHTHTGISRQDTPWGGQGLTEPRHKFWLLYAWKFTCLPAQYVLRLLGSQHIFIFSGGNSRELQPFNRQITSVEELHSIPSAHHHLAGTGWVDGYMTAGIRTGRGKYLIGSQYADLDECAVIRNTMSMTPAPGRKSVLGNALLISAITENLHITYISPTIRIRRMSSSFRNFHFGCICLRRKVGGGMAHTNLTVHARFDIYLIQLPHRA